MGIDNKNRRNSIIGFSILNMRILANILGITKPEITSIVVVTHSLAVIK